MNVMKRLVNRFLAWQLPKDFSPDAGISFKPTKPDGYGTHWWPTGTNLLTAEQAQKMFEHAIGDVSDYEASTEEEGDAFMHGYFCCKEVADTEITSANERIRELEANEQAYERIVGPKTYQEVADELTAERTALEQERLVSDKLEKALKDTLSHLVAAASLLSRSPKTAAPSNKMFDQMVVDYKAAAKRARAALAEVAALRKSERGE